MLFFESSQQTVPFLTAVAAGFCLSLLLEFPMKQGLLQVLVDFVAVFFSAAILIVFLLFCQAITHILNFWHHIVYSFFEVFFIFASISFFLFNFMNHYVNFPKICAFFLPFFLNEEYN